MNDPVKHPPGLMTLFFTEMWERVSYYGMRALLVLYLIDAVQDGGLGLDEKTAAAIYGLYTGLVYLSALPGGWVGDRLLGTKRAVWWGGVGIAAGHVMLGLHVPSLFFAGLVVIALGSGLLKSNMSTMVGQLYPEGGPRRDAGFTIFYMGINLGAFTGPLICGWLAQRFGWSWGFTAAAAGMFLGLVQYRLCQTRLEGVGERIEHAGQNLAQEWRWCWLGLAALVVLTVLCMAGVIPIDPLQLAKHTSKAITGLAVVFFVWLFTLGGLDWQEKKRAVLIVLLFASATLFWASFEQMGSSFNVFAEKHTIRQLGGFEIPTEWFQSINPLYVMIFAPVVAGLWSMLGRRGIAPALTTKVGWALLLLAAGFWLASYAAQHALAVQQVWPTWLMGIYLFNTLGELFLSPVGLSAVSKLSPVRYTGQMMGVWFLGASLGGVLSGLIASEVSGDAMAAMPGIFMNVVFIAAGSGVVLLVSSKWLSKLAPGVR